MKENLFPKRLNQIRKLKKLTTRELAKKSGVSYNSISKYENNQRIPSIDAVINLANALDVTLEYLTGGEPSYDEKQDYIKTICQKYGLENQYMNISKLSSEDLQKFESHIVIMLKGLFNEFKL